MIDELLNLLPNFPGALNRCRCFLHIVNLVAKSVLKQFDVPDDRDNAALNHTEHELIDLAMGIDMEELWTVTEQGAGGDSEGNDNTEGWVDEMVEMSSEEREELHEDIQPVHLILLKWVQILPIEC